MIWIFAGNNHLLITTWLICCSFDPIWHWACLNFSDNLTKQVKDASLLESCSHPQTKSGNLPPSSINMSLSFPREQSCSFLSKHEMVRYMKVPKKAHEAALTTSLVADAGWLFKFLQLLLAQLWNGKLSSHRMESCVHRTIQGLIDNILLDDHDHLLRSWWSSPFSLKVGLIKIWSYLNKIRSWSLLFFSKGWVEQQLVLHRTDDWQHCHRRSRRCLGKETDAFGQLQS